MILAGEAINLHHPYLRRNEILLLILLYLLLFYFALHNTLHNFSISHCLFFRLSYYNIDVAEYMQALLHHRMKNHGFSKMIAFNA